MAVLDFHRDDGYAHAPFYHKNIVYSTRERLVVVVVRDDAGEG